MTFVEAYRGRRVFLTGHTGFKGSTFTLWLKQIQAEVCGYALTPEGRLNHWNLLQLPILSIEGDITDRDNLSHSLRQFEPEIVFHFAAQPLVRESYERPLQTFETNILGTVHLLEACRRCPSLRAIVIITSDKCYENREWVWGYREGDPLGGYDPYSTSKACVELVTACYRRSFLEEAGILVATARAGNVIGGGDWSPDRLFPDIYRAVAHGQPVHLRNPQATRPWQHILDCLAGYLKLGQALLEGNTLAADAWNFGPDFAANQTVETVVHHVQQHWPAVSLKYPNQTHPHEAQRLYLDSSKARGQLGWKPVLDFEDAIATTIAWYRTFYETGRCLSLVQLENYLGKLDRLSDRSKTGSSVQN